MATQPENLFGPETAQAPLLRAFPAHDGIRPGKLGSTAAAVDLANLTPLFFDVSESEWAVWIGQANEVNTITANATPATAGDFTLTVFGEETDPIAFDATAAAVQAALEALDVVEVGDVVAVQTTGTDLGDASAVVTLTWGGQYAGQDITITLDATGLTGNAHVLATTQAGGADPAEGHLIDGFLWTPEAPHTTSTVGEQIVQVFLAGSVHAEDVAVPAGESRADLNEALLVSSLREKGIHILGLAGIH